MRTCASRIKSLSTTFGNYFTMAHFSVPFITFNTHAIRHSIAFPALTVDALSSFVCLLRTAHRAVVILILLMSLVVLFMFGILPVWSSRLNDYIVDTFTSCPASHCLASFFFAGANILLAETVRIRCGAMPRREINFNMPICYASHVTSINFYPEQHFIFFGRYCFFMSNIVLHFVIVVVVKSSLQQGGEKLNC